MANKLASKGKDNSKEDQMRDNFLVGRNIQYPPHIISNNPEHFRFTYFREDLDSTIHSPTISGLLQPGQKFEELFVGSVYSSVSNTTLVDTKASTPSQAQLQLPLQQQMTRQSQALSGSVELEEASFPLLARRSKSN